MVACSLSGYAFEGTSSSSFCRRGVGGTDVARFQVQHGVIKP